MDTIPLAHGVGGVANLPIPLSYALIGAAWALGISFAVLGLAWRTPRFRGDASGAPLPQVLHRVVTSSVTEWAVRLLGLLFTAYVGWAAFFGPDLATNPTLGVFYVWLWVGLVPLSLLLGRVWVWLSPMRTIHQLLALVMRTDRGVLPYPAGLGYWPAALGLFAFVWMELIYPDNGFVSSVRTWALLYAAVMLMGSALFGVRWFERADPFDVYAGLLARLSPWGFRNARLVVRNPLDNLDGVTPDRGLVGVVAVLLGSTAFDSLTQTRWWLAKSAGVTWLGVDIGPVLLGTLTMLGMIAIVYVTFTAASMATFGVTWRQRRALPNAYAGSVVPIVVGYMVAHYASLLVEYGQQTLLFLSDPLSDGSDYLGMSDRAVAYVLTEHPTALAVGKVLAVVTGHVLGVVAAHDKALKLLPARHALVGQIGLLLVMVGYTISGLLLLFSS